MGVVIQKLRDSARGQICHFQIPYVCNGNDETTVLCHCPSEVKGMGTKSDDFMGVFGCSACHEVLDQHKLPVADERFFWLRGLARTWAHWFSVGLIDAGVDPEKAKHRPKRPANFPSRKMQSRNTLRKSS